MEERKGLVIIVVKPGFVALVDFNHYSTMDVLGQFLKNGNFKLVGQDSKLDPDCLLLLTLTWSSC